MTARTKAQWIAVALTVLTLVAAAIVVVRSISGGGDASAHAEQREPRGAASTSSASTSSDEPAAVDIYRDWQQRREQAWRAGSTTALADLYVEPEVARGDVRLLRRWLHRGATGVDLVHQLLACDVVHQRRDDLRVRVTQRLARARVLSGAPEVDLPRGQAQRNEVWLQRVDGVWRVAEVVRLSDG